MARVKAEGLILTPMLNASGMVALDIKFEPAMVISARKVNKLGRDIRSFRVPLERSISKVMIPSIRRNFDAGGRPRWAPLEAQTIVSRASQGFGPGPILVRTGLLRRTMGYRNIWTIDREKAYIADLPEKIWYGKVHQAGATFRAASSFNLASPEHIKIMRALGRTSTDKGDAGGNGVIPARPFVVLQRQDEIRIQKVFNDWLGERIAAAGLSGGRI